MTLATIGTRHRAEQHQALLTATDAAGYLHLSRRQFYRLRPALIAAGMQLVEIPSATPGAAPLTRYTRASLDRLIEKAARTGRPLCRPLTG